MLHYAGTKDKRAITSQLVTAYRSVLPTLLVNVFTSSFQHGKVAVWGLAMTSSGWVSLQAFLKDI